MAVRNFLSLLSLPGSPRPPFPAPKRSSSRALRGSDWGLFCGTWFGLTQAQRGVRVPLPASASYGPAPIPKTHAAAAAGSDRGLGRGPASPVAPSGLLGCLASVLFTRGFFFFFPMSILSRVGVFLQAPWL